MNINTLLKSIGSTEESSFGEICRALGDDCPERGESSEWADLFRTIDQAEREGLIEVSRIHGKIDAAILTEGGVALVRKTSL